MLKLLLASLAIRFFLFEWDAHPCRWFRAGMRKIFWFAPKLWEELSHCAYCNGFWVSLVIFGVSLVGGFSYQRIIWLLPFALAGGLSNYVFQLGLNIIEAHPVNQIKTEDTEEKKQIQGA